LDKDNANAYFNRGCCYDSVGELDLAISDYSVALELDMKASENDVVNEGEERVRWNEEVFYEQ
jgi:lipoprotein NlpI